jgi:hypothetical protein
MLIRGLYRLDTCAQVYTLVMHTYQFTCATWRQLPHACKPCILDYMYLSQNISSVNGIHPCCLFLVVDVNSLMLHHTTCLVVHIQKKYFHFIVYLICSHVISLLAQICMCFILHGLTRISSLYACFLGCSRISDGANVPGFMDVISRIWDVNCPGDRHLTLSPGQLVSQIMLITSINPGISPNGLKKILVFCFSNISFLSLLMFHYLSLSVPLMYKNSLRPCFDSVILVAF